MNPNLLIPQIWPVIHVNSSDHKTTHKNAQIAAACQCQGVFLIAMEGDDRLIPTLASQIAKEHPTLGVGINLLQTEPSQALDIAIQNNFQATWADYAGVTSEEITPQGLLIQKKLWNLKTEHAFFASVAFKYQKTDPNPGKAALNAISLGMIPTTSGAGTGKAAPTEKLQKMREALGENPLAIASGVTPANVHAHVGLVTHILVATGVSKSHHELDETLLRTLVENARK